MAMQRMGKIIPAIVFFLAVIFVGIKYLDSGNRTVSYDIDQYKNINGKKCIHKNNIETYLLLGTDIRGGFSDYQGYEADETGQSDVIQLLVIDKAANSYQRLIIDRDLMADYPIYDQEGEYIDDSYGQICMAYAYGNDGKERSCENVAQTLSALFDNEKINGYLSLTLDAVRIINHQLGGVTLTIEDDFSKVCPSLEKGKKVTLTDEEAYYFCHSRREMGEGSDTNENRMKRQETYIKAAKPLFMEKVREDPDFVSKCIEELGDTVYTNITQKQMGFLLDVISTGEDRGEVFLTGESLLNEETDCMEFEPEEDQVDELMISLFYNEVTEGEKDD